MVVVGGLDGGGYTVYHYTLWVEKFFFFPIPQGGGAHICIYINIKFNAFVVVVASWLVAFYYCILLYIYIHMYMYIYSK